jgi:hypothetical protein
MIILHGGCAKIARINVALPHVGIAIVAFLVILLSDPFLTLSLAALPHELYRDATMYVGNAIFSLAYNNLPTLYCFVELFYSAVQGRTGDRVSDCRLHLCFG